MRIGEAVAPEGIATTGDTEAQLEDMPNFPFSRPPLSRWYLYWHPVGTELWRSRP